MKTIAWAIVLGSFYLGGVLSKNTDENAKRTKAAILLILTGCFLTSMVIENAR